LVCFIFVIFGREEEIEKVLLIFLAFLWGIAEFKKVDALNEKAGYLLKTLSR